MAKRLAVWMYWNMLEVPVAPLAEMATGLTGGRAQRAFFMMSGTRTITVTCGTCGKPVTVRSRDEMKRVLVAKQKRGVLPVCEPCRASQLSLIPSLNSERPVHNSTPSAFDREVLTLHAERGQPKTIEALDIWGVLRIELSPNDIRLYLQDADLGVAAALGVTRGDYLEWLEGWDLCAAAVTRPAAIDAVTSPRDFAVLNSKTGFEFVQLGVIVLLTADRHRFPLAVEQVSRMTTKSTLSRRAAWTRLSNASRVARRRRSAGRPSYRDSPTSGLSRWMSAACRKRKSCMKLDIS